MERIADLEKLMVEHGLVIRAIPLVETACVEAYNKEVIERQGYEAVTISYEEVYKREMARGKKPLSRGGKFIITQCKNQGTVINSWGNPVVFYDSIMQAVAAVVDIHHT